MEGFDMTTALDLILYPEKLFFQSFNPSVDAFFSQEKDYPPYDLFTEEDGSTTIEFSVAGYPKENLSVSADNNLLTVSATKVEDEKAKKGFVRRARRAFKKTFRDPYGKFDLTSVEATIKDGVLTVKVPLRADAKERKIEIFSR
jgi:HSP20 family protein